MTIPSLDHYYNPSTQILLFTGYLDVSHSGTQLCITSGNGFNLPILIKCDWNPKTLLLLEARYVDQNGTTTLEAKLHVIDGITKDMQTATASFSNVTKRPIEWMMRRHKQTRFIVDDTNVQDINTDPIPLSFRVLES